MKHSKDLTIRKCYKNQIIILQNISIKTYYDTFRSFTSEETMKTYLEEAYDIKKLSKEIMAKGSFFYFLYKGSEIIGYIKLNKKPFRSDINDEESLEIERIYIQKEHQGNGYGKYLINHSIKIATRLKKKYIWLGVWERNSKALVFYKKMGFEEFGKYPFRMGDEVQTDLLMNRSVYASPSVGSSASGNA
ncbi:MAG: GNAT family N-acetyltransferase [Treponema sp.]|jgi:ribosomal protein S18 acetylase RimI-like enzyme|nr:GNAT family N-acetyltransferase [Treponema sp.]